MGKRTRCSDTVYIESSLCFCLVKIEGKKSSNKQKALSFAAPQSPPCHCQPPSSFPKPAITLKHATAQCTAHTPNAQQQQLGLLCQ
jgi:hypothetical protein